MTTRVYLGPVLERVQMKDRTFALCRIELWLVNGERSYGRILENLDRPPRPPRIELEPWAEVEARLRTLVGNYFASTGGES